MTPVPMDMQYPHLGEVKNKSQRPIGLAYCIDPDAPDREKKEFEEQMLKENAYFLKDIYGLEDPYYTWKGEIIDRATGQPAKELDLHNEDADDWHGVGVIVIQNGLVLVGTRVGNGMIGGPGGHVEEGETDETAAYRETIEEFGIFPGNLIKIDDPDGGEGVEGKPTIFLCTKFVGKPKCDGEEMWEPRWMSIQGILDDGDVFEPFAYGLEVLLKNMKSTLGEWHTDKPEGGNTGLPFGLCSKYGIKIGNNWTPKDAWAALKGKTGKDPEDFYRDLEGSADEKEHAQGVSARRNYKLTGDSLHLSKANRGKIDKETVDSTMNISAKYYEKAREIASRFPALRSYLDHSQTHVAEVVDKSLEALDAIEQAIAGQPFYRDIDEKALAVAALLHDTGMDGDGRLDLYAGDSGNKLRKEHALSSAIHILENRKAIEDMGYDADEIALIVLAHSKSFSKGASGGDVAKTEEARLRNRAESMIGAKVEKRPFSLTSLDGWSNSMDKLQEAVEYHNAHNADKISFDETKFYSDQDYQDAIRTASAALRLGDAARVGGNTMLSQNGGEIVVDRSSYNPNARTAIEEAKSAKVYSVDENGKKSQFGTGDLDPDGYSRIYACGEGNFGDVKFDYDKGDQKLRQTIEIVDGGNYPLSTMFCVNERIGEFETLGRIPRKMSLKVGGKMTPEQRQRWEDQADAWEAYLKCELNIEFTGSNIPRANEQ